MSTETLQALAEELEALAVALNEAENRDRSGIFNDYFTLDKTQDLIVAWEQDELKVSLILERIGGIRGCANRIKALISTIKRQVRRQVQEQREDIIAQVMHQHVMAEALPDYLTENMPNYLIPPRFDMDLGGVYALSTSGDGEVIREKICTAPMLIVRRGRDVDSGLMQVEVAWVEPPGPGRGCPSWRFRTVERSNLFDGKKLLSLIDFGAPVTSVNVSQVVKWLSAFEDVNNHKIPLTNGAVKLGWQGDKSFLLPDVHIRLDHHQDLKLFPMEGMGAIVGSLRTQGTWEEWLSIIAQIRDHPLAMLALYGSVASVLQHITKCSNFAIDWSNETSTGKTTSLRVAASVWGNPADDDEHGYIYSWDSTKVWAERAAGFLHSLPLILDETKRVNSRDRISETVYDFCSGKGKGRGTLQGIDSVLSWNSVLLSTGEQRLTSFTNDGGVRARVLALQGAPIQGPVATARPLADKLRSVLMNNYGHLGRRVVKYLVYHHESWDDFKTAYEKRRDAYASISNTSVGGRLAAYVAQLDLAQAVCETLGVPAPTNDPIEYLIQAVREGADDADRARDAFVAVVSWATMNRHRFWGSKSVAVNGRPGNGFVGRWDDGDPDWSIIAIEVNAIRELLDRYGYIFDEVVNRWKSRGYLLGTVRGLSRTQRIEGMPTACICLMRDAYEELIAAERPDIDHTELQQAQYDMIEEAVVHEDSSWASRANDNHHDLEEE